MIIVLLLALVSARSAEPILKQMNGVWRSAGLTIVLDTDRMLGSTQSDKPFQRDTLRIRNITGQMVVFDIGAQSYVGLFNGKLLSLTGASITGTAMLTLDLR